MREETGGGGENRGGACGARRLVGEGSKARDSPREELVLRHDDHEAAREGGGVDGDRLIFLEILFFLPGAEEGEVRCARDESRGDGDVARVVCACSSAPRSPHLQKCTHQDSME